EAAGAGNDVVHEVGAFVLRFGEVEDEGRVVGDGAGAERAGGAAVPDAEGAFVDDGELGGGVVAAEDQRAGAGFGQGGGGAVSGDHAAELRLVVLDDHAFAPASESDAAGEGELAGTRSPENGAVAEGDVVGDHARRGVRRTDASGSAGAEIDEAPL